MSVAHEKFGKLEWSELIDPIVELVRNGVFVTQELLNFICSRDLGVYDTNKSSKRLQIVQSLTVE